MAKGCNSACPYNTLYGCKAEEYNATCPMKPKTNADRIRAMSDEELVKWVSDGCPPGEHKCKGVACDDCWMQWLKQPAEVDNG